MTKPAIDPFKKIYRRPVDGPALPNRPTVGYSQLNNRPPLIVHNHSGGGVVKSEGFSRTAPDYHLFQCEAFSDRPRKLVRFLDFSHLAFSPESKAGRGGCSMRHCPSDAEFMDEAMTQAYCEGCAMRVRGVLPCSWTSIVGCRERMGLGECGVCREERD